GRDRPPRARGERGRAARGAPGGAERPHGPRDVVARLRAGDGHRRAQRHVVRSPRQPAREGGVPRGMTRLGDGRDGVVPFGRHRPVIAPDVFVAPGTWIIGEVTIAAAASVWFGAVLRGDAGPIVIGPGTLVEDNVVLHGAITTGTAVVLGHGAVVHDSTIGDRAVIGSNATVFGATVGEGAIVAIGSVVNPRTVVPPN